MNIQKIRTESSDLIKDLRERREASQLRKIGRKVANLELGEFDSTAQPSPREVGKGYVDEYPTKLKRVVSLEVRTDLGTEVMNATITLGESDNSVPKVEATLSLDTQLQAVYPPQPDVTPLSLHEIYKDIKSVDRIQHPRPIAIPITQ